MWEVIVAEQNANWTAAFPTGCCGGGDVSFRAPERKKDSVGDDNSQSRVCVLCNSPMHATLGHEGAISRRMLSAAPGHLVEEQTTGSHRMRSPHEEES